MTVTVTSTFVRAAGNGVTTVVNFPFLVTSSGDLVVRDILDSTGTPTTLALNTHYTVQLSATGEGGTVTFLSVLVSGHTYDIRSNIPATQGEDIRNQGRFLPEIHEGVFDKAVRLIQDLTRRVGQSIQAPDYESSPPNFTLPNAVQRALNFLAFDSSGNIVVSSGTGGGDAALRNDLANATTAGKGNDLISYRRTTAESAALVTPVTYSVAPYIRGRYTNFADWKAACDQAGAEGRLDADYAIVADTALPKKCDFAGFQITGAFYTSHDLQSHGYVYNWRAKQPRIRGAFYCVYTGIDTGTNDTGFMEVWGGNGSSNPGTFWCQIGIAYTTKCTISANNFDVNQNTFTGGICRYLHLTGGGGGSGKIHANTFASLDFSNNSLPNKGVLQDDTARQVNMLVGCYYELGSDIIGSFNIIGQQGDGNSPPKLDRYQHLLFSVGVNQKNRGDFMSLARHNLIRGGCWDWLDSTGKPPGFDNVGGASVSVVTDSTAQGFGKRYEATFQQIDDRFTVEIQASGQPWFSAAFIYKSTLGFVAVSSDDGTGEIFHDVTTIDLGSSYKLARMSGPAHLTNSMFLRLYGATSTSGAIAATAFSMVAAFACGERCAVIPAKNDEYGSVQNTATEVLRVGGVSIQAGTVTQALVATPTTQDITVTFAEAFASVSGLAVTFDIEATAAASANATKLQIKSGTLTTAGCTVTVTYATNFQGILHWQAVGRRV